MLRRITHDGKAKLRATFKEASPFPHIVLENFLAEEVANNLLKDFPRFNPALAKNEFGQLGPKCVHSDIKSISHNYSLFYTYINSEGFLSEISELTGIAELIPDPNLFGAGTHENIDGAELAPHVDFNYESFTKNHRRLNLLIYLNEEWDTEWGGAIELHSNPFGWVDNTDSVSTINCLFNRCVIFETSERSWHGFRQIRLPHQKKHLSRKLISIYLYTKDRPKNEIAAPHGTFYLPYIPDFKQIQNEDYANQVKGSFIKRDRLLKASWENELRLSQQVLELTSQITELKKAIQPSVVGFALIQKNSVSGYFHDGWIGPYFRSTFQPLHSVNSIRLIGFNSATDPIKVEMRVNQELFSTAVETGGFSCEFKFKNPIDDPFTFCVESPPSPKDPENRDLRELSLILNQIQVL